jgi:hypothetical protein
MVWAPEANRIRWERASVVLCSLDWARWYEHRRYTRSSERGPTWVYYLTTIAIRDLLYFCRLSLVIYSKHLRDSKSPDERALLAIHHLSLATSDQFTPYDLWERDVVKSDFLFVAIKKALLIPRVSTKKIITKVSKELTRKGAVIDWFPFLPSQKSHVRVHPSMSTPFSSQTTLPVVLMCMRSS